MSSQKESCNLFAISFMQMVGIFLIHHPLRYHSKCTTQLLARKRPKSIFLAINSIGVYPVFIKVMDEIF